VDAARAHPKVYAKTTLGVVVGHHETILRALTSKPVAIGHSFGGLIAQTLAGRGLAAATVALSPAPFRGVLPQIQKFLLGVDLGTSATKASLYDSTGNLLSEGCAEVPLSYPQPDAVDQDMQDFCQSAAVAVRQCMGAALKVVLQINAREEELRHRPDDPNDNGVKTPK
jgi:pimeloyl-ACP methyl ester carboxylesterase